MLDEEGKLGIHSQDRRDFRKLLVLNLKKVNNKQLINLDLKSRQSPTMKSINLSKITMRSQSIS